MREEKRDGKKERKEGRIFLEKINIYLLMSSNILKFQHWLVYFLFFQSSDIWEEDWKFVLI